MCFIKSEMTTNEAVLVSIDYEHQNAYLGGRFEVIELVSLVTQQISTLKQFTPDYFSPQYRVRSKYAHSNYVQTGLELSCGYHIC